MYIGGFYDPRMYTLQRDCSTKTKIIVCTLIFVIIIAVISLPLVHFTKTTPTARKKYNEDYNSTDMSAVSVPPRFIGPALVLSEKRRTVEHLDASSEVHPSSELNAIGEMKEDAPGKPETNSTYSSSPPSSPENLLSRKREVEVSIDSAYEDYPSLNPKEDDYLGSKMMTIPFLDGVDFLQSEYEAIPADGDYID